MLEHIVKIEMNRLGVHGISRSLFPEAYLTAEEPVKIYDTIDNYKLRQVKCGKARPCASGELGSLELYLSSGGYCEKGGPNRFAFSFLRFSSSPRSYPGKYGRRDEGEESDA